MANIDKSLRDYIRAIRTINYNLPEESSTKSKSKTMQKKYSYSITEEIFDVECGYKINENDVSCFKEPLTEILNKEYGDKGYEVYKLKFESFIFYSEEDLITYESEHSVPYNSIIVYVYSRKLVDSETSDSKTISKISDLMLTMSDKITALTDKVSRLESLLEDKEKKQSNKKI